MATRFLKAQNGGIYTDSTGKPIVVDMSLPTLSNPATAEDIASGKEAINEDGVVVTGTAERVEKYFDIEGTITTTTTSLVLENIPSNVHDIIIVLETRDNSTAGGSGKLTQIGLHSTRTSALSSTVIFVAYRQAYTSVYEISATYDSGSQTLTLTNSNIAKNLPYRYFVKLY